MVNSYILLIESDIKKVSNEIFNVGFENLKVKEIAQMVKKVVGDDVTLETTPTDDNRSYHISAKKIMSHLNFKPSFTIEDGVFELVNKFKKQKINRYFK